MKNGLDFAGQGGDRDQRSPSTARSPASARRHRPNHSADFAREAVISVFGWNHGKALDQADFRDRQPDQFPVPTPEASPL